MKKRVEGTVVFSRSSKGSGECVCCDGNHIFSKSIRLIDQTKKYPGRIHATAEDFLQEVVGNMPESVEGKRVRVTVELVSDELETMGAAYSDAVLAVDEYIEKTGKDRDKTWDTVNQQHDVRLTAEGENKGGK